MIEFRRATVADVAVLQQIEQCSFADPWNDDMLSSELRMPHSVYMLMTLDGQVAGYYAYMHILDEAHILNVAVLPAYRGRGLGRALMRHLVDNVPPDVVGITLEVRAGNAVAIGLYESLGFVRSGVRPRYYDNREDAYIYWRGKGAEDC